MLGAAGLEVVGAVLIEGGAPEYLVQLEVFVEETLELTGIWLFIAGALSLLRHRSLEVVFE